MTVPIHPGDQLSDFDAKTLDGRTVHYRDLWQNKLVVLVTLPVPPSAGTEAYREELARHLAALTAHDTVLLVRGVPAGAPIPPPLVPLPSVVIADRWGEVRHVAGGPDNALPSTGELVEWLRFVQMECPECQGESR